MRLDGNDIIMFCYGINYMSMSKLSIILFIFQSFPNSIQISADSEATSVTLREISVLTSQRSLQQLGQRCFEPDAVVVSISLLKNKILGCIKCIMSSLTNLYNYRTLHLIFHLFVVHPLLSTKKLATKRPVEPARPEVAVPGVLEPLACEPCRPLTGGAPWKGQGWQIRLGKVSMMILGVSKK